MSWSEYSHFLMIGMIFCAWMETFPEDAISITSLIFVFPWHCNSIKWLCQEKISTQIVWVLIKIAFYFLGGIWKRKRRQHERIFRQFKKGNRRFSGAKSRFSDAEMAEKTPWWSLREFFRYTLRKPLLRAEKRNLSHKSSTVGPSLWGADGVKTASFVGKGGDPHPQKSVFVHRKP